MAFLENDETRAVLRPRHRVGRSAGSHTQILTRNVSGEHAVISWTGERWELRDLGSRNGTWLDERKLEPGERAALQTGGRIAFGNPATIWRLGSTQPPGPAALTDEGVLEGSELFLALPSEDDPQAVVEFDPEMGWCLSQDNESRAAEDGASILLGDQTYVLALPGHQPPDPSTVNMTEISSVMDKLIRQGLDFAVSADEEYIEVTARVGPDSPPHPHHELLLVLARKRLADRSEGHAESEQGWVYTSDLRAMLRISANQLYVMSHRCKRELEEVGIEPGRLLEKRTTSRQLRLGIQDLSVSSL